MSNKALAYAEQTLEVHEIYTHAKSLLKDLERIQDRLTKARHDRREMDDQISDLEVDIQIDELAKHPSTSATAMKEHLKVAIRKNASHIDLRSQHRALQTQVDVLEVERSFIENQIKVATARLTELGGYLQYLAAVKLAASGTTPMTPAPEGARA